MNPTQEEQMIAEYQENAHKRTLRQNAAMHVYFKELAEMFNEHGLDQRKVLKETIDIPWDGKAVKNQLWRPVQKALLGKTSTTELDTVEPGRVWEVINKHIGEKFGIHIPFPSIDHDETRRR